RSDISIRRRTERVPLLRSRKGIWQDRHQSLTGSPAMSTVNELVVGYLAAWNEHDADRRRALIGRVWTEDATYVDAHLRGVGHHGIDAMIATAQAQFPGYRLRLASGIESHNGYVRFSWAAGGAPEAPLYLGGTDFGIVAPDGRLKMVAGFVDASPAM